MTEKYAVVIRTVFSELMGVVGPFESYELAADWIRENVETEKCLSDIRILSNPTQILVEKSYDRR